MTTHLAAIVRRSITKNVLRPMVSPTFALSLERYIYAQDRRSLGPTSLYGNTSLRSLRTPFMRPHIQLRLLLLTTQALSTPVARSCGVQTRDDRVLLEQPITEILSGSCTNREATTVGNRQQQSMLKS